MNLCIGRTLFLSFLGACNPNRFTLKPITMKTFSAYSKESLHAEKFQSAFMSNSRLSEIMKRLLLFCIGWFCYFPTVFAQTTIVTDHINNNGNGSVTFNVQNTNAFDITINEVSCHLGTDESNSLQLLYRTNPFNDVAQPWDGGIVGAGQNGWILAGTATVSSDEDDGVVPAISGLSLVIPAGMTYQLGFSGNEIEYQTLISGDGLNTFSAAGVNLITGDGISWGGPSYPATPGNYPRGFIGGITFCSPKPIIVSLGGDEFCEGGQNKLRTSLTYYSYQWYRNEQLIPGANTKSITNTDGGDFTVFVSDSIGCEGFSDPLTITVNPLPAVELNVPTINEFCEPTTLPLTAVNTPNATYQWYRNGSILAGEVGNSYTVSLTGLYQLSALSELGCKALSKNVLVSVKPAPSVPTISNSESNKLLSSSAENNQWYKNGVLIVGAVNQALNISENAVYAVVVTNPNGCYRESADFMVNNVGIYTTAGQGDSWRIYPNPFIDKLRIDASESASYQVFDVNGKVVAVGDFRAGTNELNLGGLSKGIYQLRGNVKATSAVIKLIKE